jgi:hypothetical protein
MKKLQNTDNKIIKKLLLWLKPAYGNKCQRLETSVYKKTFETEAGEKVLEDLAARVYGRVITDETDDTALRMWAGEGKLLKYILNKTFNNGDKK